MKNRHESLTEFNSKLFKKPIVIYGMSQAAISMYVNLSNASNKSGAKVEVLGFTDSYQNENTKKLFCGKKIFSKKQFHEMAGNVNVVIATTTNALEYEISEILCEIGFDEESIFSTFAHYGFNERPAVQYIKQNRDEFDRVQQSLKDEKSKIIYGNIIKYYLESNKKYIKEAFELSKKTGSQYFDKELIKFGKNEVFVDCGAYIGDTIVEFAKEVNLQFEKIYAFEANKGLFSIMDTLFCVNKIEGNIEVLPYAVFSSAGEICFNSNGFSVNSSISDRSENGDIVKTVRIDDIVKDSKVSFVKMDIEGAELEALKGAESTIQRDKPKMAICIYHSNGIDLLEIPQYLMKKYPNYNYYVRHYSSNFPHETVLYCIPSEE